MAILIGGWAVAPNLDDLGSIERRLAVLEEKERKVAGRSDPRIPSLATGFDVEDAVFRSLQLLDITAVLSGTEPDPVNSITYLVQMGSNVPTLAADGDGTVIFPTPFPNGLVVVLMSNGDTSTNPDATIGYHGTQATPLTTFDFATNLGAGLFRINWIAIGW